MVAVPLKPGRQLLLARVVLYRDALTRNAFIRNFNAHFTTARDIGTRRTGASHLRTTSAHKGPSKCAERQRRYHSTPTARPLQMPEKDIPSVGLSQDPSDATQAALNALHEGDHRASSSAEDGTAPPMFRTSLPTPSTKAIQLTLNLPSYVADSLLSTEAMKLSINGSLYAINLIPTGSTVDQLRAKQLDLKRMEEKLLPLSQRYRKLMKRASQQATFVIWSSLGVLGLQAAIVAKLTFFSRFGWDVMEPVTYFLTFGVGVGGLLFFQLNKMEYTYPAVFHLVSARKARKLFKKHNFNLEAYEELKRAVDKKRQEINHITLQHGHSPELHLEDSIVELAYRAKVVEEQIAYLPDAESRQRESLYLHELYSLLSQALAKKCAMEGPTALTEEIQALVGQAQTVDFRAVGDILVNAGKLAVERHRSEHAQEEWQSAIDLKTGRRFYYNLHTGEQRSSRPFKIF